MRHCTFSLEAVGAVRAHWGIQNKRLKAGWDEAYLPRLLMA